MNNKSKTKFSASIKNVNEFIISGLILYFFVPLIVESFEYHTQYLGEHNFFKIIQSIIERNSIKLSKFKIRKINSKYLSVPDSLSGNTLVREAIEYLQTPYRLGGLGKKSIDCSGLTYLVFKKYNVILPRTAREQFQIGKYIAKMNQLKPGDLIFFSTSFLKNPDHVGLYIGDNRMIHASAKLRCVVCVRINKRWYKRRFIGGKRVFLS